MKRILLFLLTLISLAHATPTQTMDLSSAAGLKWEFKLENGEWKAIQVPAGGWKTQGFQCDAGTYRTTLSIPAHAGGNLTRVHFEAVNFGAEVFAGPDEAHLQKVASHINGWMPFDADLSPVAVAGQPLLLQVEVKGRNKFKANGKYTVPEAATWCPTIEEGILRGVRLEITPQMHIENVTIETHCAPDKFSAKVWVKNDGDKPAEAALGGSFVTHYRARVALPNLPTQNFNLAPHETRLVEWKDINWPVGASNYWWPNVPYKANYLAKLFSLNLTLKSGAQTHEVSQRFGFREFKVVGNHYELNGVRCNLRGDNQQEADFGTDAYGVKAGFGPPSANNPGWPQAVDNLLRLNFNVLRIHQVPATPYMLDVCDEKGLMIVDETPLRRSEGGEDWDAGRENMTRMVQELARRDRNHPSIVIFSAMNEPFGVPVETVRELVEAMRKEDGTRPIIVDGIGNLAPDIINMEHYVNGLGKLPQNGGSIRQDRPYGETEAVWDADNTWQGFAWMATSVRTRRLKGDSDLRNYVLNNAWSNYVPGESNATEILEKKVKNMGGSHEILPPLENPWTHPNILLMQQCYHPLAACDVKFDQQNARSNDKGEWPVVKPKLPAGKRVTRQIAVFNDEFEGENLTLVWSVRTGGIRSSTFIKDEVDLKIPRGEFKTTDITFDVPQTGEVTLLLSVWKDGKERFSEGKIVFEAGEPVVLKDGDYYLINRNSGHPLDTAGGEKADAPVFQNAKDAAKSPVWKIKLLGNDDLQILNAKTGLALAVRGGQTANEVPIVQQTPDNSPSQIWHFSEVEEGFYTLTNKASGKLLDVYGRATGNNARVVQWESNGGENQQWSFEKR